MSAAEPVVRSATSASICVRVRVAQLYTAPCSMRRTASREPVTSAWAATLGKQAKELSGHVARRDHAVEQATYQGLTSSPMKHGAHFKVVAVGKIFHRWWVNGVIRARARMRLFKSQPQCNLYRLHIA